MSCTSGQMPKMGDKSLRGGDELERRKEAGRKRRAAQDGAGGARDPKRSERGAEGDDVYGMHTSAHTQR